MANQDKIDELLLLWQERRKAGQEVSVETLCVGYPDLLPTIQEGVRKLKKADALLHELEKGTEPGQADAETWPDPLPGYEILAELGRGGMGVVYKARHIALNRVVALKMLRPQAHPEPGELARFRKEAEAVARLQHPHIVQIYEVGEREGRPYFSMEFVDGGSLDRKIDKTPQPPRRAAELLEQLARTMHVAHEHGIIHRDLKPANVLLTADGTPKVADFGLAKHLDVDPGLTKSGAIVGTPSYMAPEQAAGNRKEQPVTHLIDVYALGVSLYEMLTGRPPFLAETPLDTLLQVVQEEPVPPRRLQPKVPRDLETICLKCLEKEPARRYASAQALADDLRRFLRGESIWARPVGQGERLWRWSRRNPMVAALLTAVVVLLFAGSGVSAYFAVQADNRAREADQKAQEATLQEGKANENAHQMTRLAEQRLQENITGRRYLYAAHLNLAQRAWEDNQLGRLLELLEGQRPQRTANVDLRDCEWYFWWHLCHADLLSLPGHPPGTSTRAAAEVGRLLEVYCLHGPKEGRARGVALGADGNILVSGTVDETVKVWDAVTGKELHTLKGHTGRISSLALSADGTILLSGSDDGTMKIWDTASGREIRTLKGQTRGGVKSVALSADGTILVSATLLLDRTNLWPLGGGVEVWDLTSGKVTRTLVNLFDLAKNYLNAHLAIWLQPQPLAAAACSSYSLTVPPEQYQEVLSVALSADGKTLVTGDMLGTVRVWDTASGAARHNLTGHTGAVWSVALSADGQTIVSGSWDRAVKVWDARNGRELHTLAGHRGDISRVAVSADGKTVFSGSWDGTVKIWDAGGGQEIRTLKGHTTLISSLALSADGKRLASSDTDGTVKLWDVGSHPNPLTLRGHAGQILGVLFSSDGNRILTGCNDNTLKVWNAHTGLEIRILKGPTRPVTSAAFSRDGQRLASGYDDGTIKVWNAHTGEATLTIKGPAGWVISLAISADGQTIVSGSADFKLEGDETPIAGGEVNVWDAGSGKNLRTFKVSTGAVNSMALSPDGRIIACGNADGTVKVWDTVTGHELHTLKGSAEGVQSLAFSSDGDRLVGGGADGTIQIWDAHSGQETLTLKGHAGKILSVAFSPNGNRLVSGSSDGTAKVWDTTTGQEILTLPGYAAEVHGVAFSPDGFRLAVSASDVVQVWDATPVK